MRIIVQIAMTIRQKKKYINSLLKKTHYLIHCEQPVYNK